MAFALVVAGLVLMRQRPGTAKGVIFMTIEDETGTANIIVWPKILKAARGSASARGVAIAGEAQVESGVVHLIARKVEDIFADLRKIKRASAATPRARNFC